MRVTDVDSYWPETFLPAGAIIYREGESGGTLYVLCQGKIGLYKELNGRQAALSLLGPGCVFGDADIADAQLQQTTAKCLTDCVVAVITHDQLSLELSNSRERLRGLFGQLLCQYDQMSRTNIDRLARVLSPGASPLPLNPAVFLP
jgi:CRP-like cAMP-binding protein